MNNTPNPVYYPQPQPEPPKEKNGAAVVSLVMGILSLVFACCGGSLIFGIVGIITAIVSKSKSSTGKLNGMAIAGLIMSIVGVVAGLITLIAFLIPAIIAGGSGGFDEIFRELERSLR